MTLLGLYQNPSWIINSQETILAWFIQALRVYAGRCWQYASAANDAARNGDGFPWGFHKKNIILSRISVWVASLRLLSYKPWVKAESLAYSVSSIISYALRYQTLRLTCQLAGLKKSLQLIWEFSLFSLEENGRSLIWLVFVLRRTGKCNLWDK